MGSSSRKVIRRKIIRIVQRNKPLFRPISYYFPALFPHDVMIYVLVDPIDGQIHYVGQTNNAARRLRSHIRAARPWLLTRNIAVGGHGRRAGKTTMTTQFLKNSSKDVWIAGLLAKNLVPLMILVEYVPKNIADEAEKYWIRVFHGLGYQLFNVVHGIKLRKP